MGEIADDMIDGDCCDICGQYFEKADAIYEHGHPATCWDCWKTLNNEEKKHHTKSDVKTF